MASSSVWIQFIRNALCVLKSILTLPALNQFPSQLQPQINFLLSKLSELHWLGNIERYQQIADQMMKEYNTGIPLDISDLKNSLFISFLIAITQFLAFHFNLMSAFEHLVLVGFNIFTKSRTYNSAVLASSSAVASKKNCSVIVSG